MVSLAGDFHNFTQAVRRISAPDGSEYFEKPRTLFWEWLFFGFDSPLKRYFKGMDQSIFNLKIKFNSEGLTGNVENVFSDESFSLNKENLKGFGFLLGYSYVFGLQDLHRENILVTKNGLQVIDVETVFAKFVLPNETLLLPFKDTTFEKSGLGVLLNSIATITPQIVFPLLEGFVSSLTLTEINLEQIHIDIKTAMGDQRIPIRIILRDTNKYRHWKTFNFDQPLFDEELEQLKRGDIPYFFKYAGIDDLFYYTHSDGRYASVALSPYFKEKIIRIGVEPQTLLTSCRIKSELFPNGTLVLLKKLMPTNYVGHHSFSGTEISITSDKYSISSSWGKFEASR